MLGHFNPRSSHASGLGDARPFSGIPQSAINVNRNAPVPALRLQTSDAGSLKIEISDIPSLIRQRVRKGPVQQVKQTFADNEDDLLEEFPFIPPLFLARLFSFYTNADQFRRIYGQDWVREWKNGHKHLTVWQQVANAMDESVHEEVIRDFIIEITEKLAVLTLNNARIETQTDEARILAVNRL